MKREVMKARELIKIARLSLTLGDSRYAIALLRHLLAHLPRYLEARLLLGNLLARRGELEEARRQGEVVLAVDPANYEALQGLRLLSRLPARAGRTGWQVPGQARDQWLTMTFSAPLTASTILKRALRGCQPWKVSIVLTSHS